jgi:zinc protease
MENGKCEEMENGKWKMENSFVQLKFTNLLQTISLHFGMTAVCLSAFVFTIFSQTQMPPAPSAPRAVKIPAVQEKTLPNGLKVVVVERKNVPLVMASLLVKTGGANAEDDARSGVADMTGSLLLKGTKTRTATQIAEDVGFLGGTISSSANWNSSTVWVNATTDKFDKVLAIMADAVLNPTFAQKEIDLYKTQLLDDLTVQLKQPSALANFVASRYTYGEHSVYGTPETIAKIGRADISNFYRQAFIPNQSVLIFTGDITAAQANALARKYFGVWKSVNRQTVNRVSAGADDASRSAREIVKRILVVDLPDSGQAAVTYAKRLSEGRVDEDKASKVYYPALVANSVLGGGYTNRLNLEIRIKRGLSYGARSSVSWREANSNFSAGAQTKNVSAAEVAELLAAEIDRIGRDSVGADELKPRTATLTGNFSRTLETTGGLAAQISELYLYGINPTELNSYMQNLQTVTDAQVKAFASANIKGGDIIIVGDYAKFKDDLAKRFPALKVEVIPASQLDLNSDTLRKAK